MQSMIEQVVDQRLAATEARLLAAIGALAGARKAAP